MRGKLGLVAAIISAICIGALAQQAPTKGRMVTSGPVVNASVVDSKETTRTKAKPSAPRAMMMMTPTDQPIIQIDPGPGDGGGGGGGPIGGGGTGGTGTGGTGTGGTGTGTGGTGTGGGGSTTWTPPSVTPGGVLASILQQNPGDTTAGYPPNTASGAGTWTAPDGVAPTTDSDMSSAMGNLTGTVVTDPGGTGTTGTGTGTASTLVCKCCGADLETKQITDTGTGDAIIDLYMTYEIWHTRHWSGNFWHGYDHSYNVMTYQVLGDIYGNNVPNAIPQVPMVYNGTYGINVPQGTNVPSTEGPAEPASFPAPTVCPKGDGNGDNFAVGLMEVHKIKVPVHVPQVVSQNRWAVICKNGHDQALPCSSLDVKVTTGGGTGGGGTGPKDPFRVICPNCGAFYNPKLGVCPVCGY